MIRERQDRGEIGSLTLKEIREILDRVPAETVADVVAVLNDIGASARDIIAILEALKAAGALQAELVVM